RDPVTDLSSAPPARSRAHAVLAGVSPGYPPRRGRLLTCYAPVRHSPAPEGAEAYDLHVLSAPPAFVLSQDQTLRMDSFDIAPLRTNVFPRLLGIHHFWVPIDGERKWRLSPGSSSPRSSLNPDCQTHSWRGSLAPLSGRLPRDTRRIVIAFQCNPCAAPRHPLPCAAADQMFSKAPMIHPRRAGCQPPAPHGARSADPLLFPPGPPTPG